jgi:hypothetical protein
MKEGDSLDLRSALLHRLWKRQWDGDGTLATAAELHMLLIGDGHLGLELRSVKRSLERLQKDGFLESTQIPRVLGHSGPAPKGYRMAPDPPIITRKSTAQIVLKLLHDPRRLVAEQVLIVELLKMNLHRDDTGIAVTEDDLHNQLEWCIHQGYIRVSESANDPENPGGQRRLCTTWKVHGEFLFLELICERKGPASADRAFSGAIESVDKVVGICN